jgi:hypothetical protein
MVPLHLCDAAGYGDDIAWCQRPANSNINAQRGAWYTVDPAAVARLTDHQPPHNASAVGQGGAQKMGVVVGTGVVPRSVDGAPGLQDPHAIARAIVGHGVFHCVCGFPHSPSVSALGAIMGFPILRCRSGKIEKALVVRVSRESYHPTPLPSPHIFRGWRLTSLRSPSARHRPVQCCSSALTGICCDSARSSSAVRLNAAVMRSVSWRTTVMSVC